MLLEGMLPLPHRYSVETVATAEGSVVLHTEGVRSLETAPPAEFGGPGDRWSPETLLVGAIVDCYVLTFRAAARTSALRWTTISCRGMGKLDRTDGVTRFTSFALAVHLTTPLGTDTERARRLLEKAEHSCLITNSLMVRPSLTIDVSCA